MKKYIILCFFILSACGGSFPYRVYHPDLYKGEIGFITARKPLYVIVVDGMSIFEIEKKFRRKKSDSFDQKRGFYLIPGDHTIIVDGATRIQGEYLMVSGSLSLRVHITGNQKYLIDYEKSGKDKKGAKSIRVFIKNVRTGREVGALSK